MKQRSMRCQAGRQHCAGAQCPSIWTEQLSGVLSVSFLLALRPALPFLSLIKLDRRHDASWARHRAWLAPACLRFASGVGSANTARARKSSLACMDFCVDFVDAKGRVTGSWRDTWRVAELQGAATQRSIIDKHELGSCCRLVDIARARSALPAAELEACADLEIRERRCVAHLARTRHVHEQQVKLVLSCVCLGMLVWHLFDKRGLRRT